MSRRNRVRAVLAPSAWKPGDRLGRSCARGGPVALHAGSGHWPFVPCDMFLMRASTSSAVIEVSEVGDMTRLIRCEIALS
jgi:hypothetical protein